MNTAIIDTSPLLSSGISMFLNKRLSLSSIKTFNNFEEFVLSISNNNPLYFDLIILNSTGFKDDQIIGYLRILNSTIEKGNIVLIIDKTYPPYLKSGLSQIKIHHFFIDNNMKDFESLIKSIAK